MKSKDANERNDCDEALFSLVATTTIFLLLLTAIAALYFLGGYYDGPNNLPSLIF